MDPNSASSLAELQQQADAALSDLARLGHSDDAASIVDSVAATVDYTTVTDNADLSDDGKRKALANRYIAVMLTLARQLGRAAQSAATQDNTDAAQVLGIAGLPGDVASLAISRRDATDRVSELADAVSLQRLLDQATRTGDEVLARAIATQALTLGLADVLNSFTAHRPQLADAVTRLWNSQQHQSRTLNLKAAWSVAALKPALLANLQPYEIERLASGETNVGRWNVGA